MSEAIFFYAFSGLMLAAALSVVFSRQPIYSVLSLLVAMLCLAGLFVLLGAFFVAALQILLYAGAVLVLFLFVMMLLNADQQARERVQWFGRAGIGIIVAALLCLQLTWMFKERGNLPHVTEATAPSGTVAEIGRLLFTTYMLPFEITSFLILAAIVGAITLARSHDTE